jgi:uncharacterized protein YndB with AHSA1/START domain
MEKVTKTITVLMSKEKAFDKFVNHLNEWWPKEYTWSQEHLVEIKIDPKKDGLCTEIGPFGFRCDWGRVMAIEPNEKIKLKWQISPKRVPEPNPDKASSVTINFIEILGVTALAFEHADFENHGEGAKEYQQAMDSEQGWDYILKQYVEFCKKL